MVTAYMLFFSKTVVLLILFIQIKDKGKTTDYFNIRRNYYIIYTYEFPLRILQ